MAARCLLYYVTDCKQFPGDPRVRRESLLGKIAEAARAGVEYIQLRERDLSTRELEVLARQAVAAVREHSTTTQLLINSRTDVALAAGADGVHLRSDDLPALEVRRIWSLCGAGVLARERPVIASSCHSTADVLRAESETADFAVFAPVFEKKGASPAGLAALREACKAKIPVFALGGVTMENAAACREAGAAGIAGIRLFQENEIRKVVRALRNGIV